MEAAPLHFDTDFELHRLSGGPGGAAVSRPTTRRVVAVLCDNGDDDRLRARNPWRSVSAAPVLADA
jgi:hypothetical protein